MNENVKSRPMTAGKLWRTEPGDKEPGMTPRPLKISIVTPSFNQGAYIEEALQSVKEQNYPDVEHIVIDGASTDGTVEILKRYSSQPGWEYLRWVSESDRGQSDALNKGFRMATGDIQGWLNSDDRYCAGCFDAVCQAFAKYVDADIIYGDYNLIDESGRLLQIRREIEFSAFILSYHKVLYIPTPSSFFKRRVFDQGHFLDLRLDYAMDYEFFLRLTRQGYRFKHIPGLLADFRWHSECKSAGQSQKVLEAHDRVAIMYSPILRKLPEGLSRTIAMKGLRVAAAGLRYSEKFLRGYYWGQFRSGRTSA